MNTSIKNYINSTISIIRILRYFRTPDKFEKVNKDNQICFVLGNGPSLADDFQKISNLDIMKEIWCVNFFADTDNYTKIKP